MIGVINKSFIEPLQTIPSLHRFSRYYLIKGRKRIFFEFETDPRVGSLSFSLYSFYISI